MIVSALADALMLAARCKRRHSADIAPAVRPARDPTECTLKVDSKHKVPNQRLFIGMNTIGDDGPCCNVLRANVLLQPLRGHYQPSNNRPRCCRSSLAPGTANIQVEFQPSQT